MRVVGTGLLGTSIGLGLRGEDVDVLLSDPSPTALAMARDLGAGRLPSPDDGEPTLVVVAAPPDVTARVVAAELLAHPEAVVTDVASVKGAPARALTSLLADTSPSRRYVGGHPLAGRERSGAVAARADLFLGRPWVLTPEPDVSVEAVAVVRDLALDLGATPVLMSAQAHDAAVARVSHVPQVVSSLLAARLLDTTDDAVALAGPGIRDMTRIAASEPGLWVQILSANAGPVAAVLRALHRDLGAVVDSLEALAADEDAFGARAVVASAIQHGNEGHARIPGKHGAPPTRYEVVTVLVPDRPGELGRLFSEMGEVGVNLEDLHLEHSPGQPVGLAEVSVLPAARPVLERALAERGWVLPG